jgi:SNF2 family DNA or RNA helicase
MDLLRLNFSGKNVTVTGKNGEPSEIVKRIMELKPSRPFIVPHGLKSELRQYQKIGAEWLFYLYENAFGGLLCDDMGLGKTHQIMAFLLGLREQEEIAAPFLVVCPTTVLSHWETKVRAHAPSLKEVIYYGSDRDLESALRDGSLILTSYGVLTRDIEKLKKIPFSVAVFDEIQHIKNPETLSHKAASEIMADMKAGLTGTPIENRLEELKALFDLTVPGYLKSDINFFTRYIAPIQENKDKERQEELAKVISPFILRRLKRTVLDELPDKIEDILNCTLSNHQIKLYKDAVDSRGAGLLESLRKSNEPVPYMHIFALLNLLKQICNHPALAEKAPEKYETYESGKWELFKEILGEAIENGNKVVVYSQYLDMIDIMERYLVKEGIGHVALTGKSRKRGDIVKSFSDDPDCKVFIGSLKAGGVGIDLIAASVVIHYDRWWNAAKEDQATDRVHRIGQKRGVQVFKLVTEGTLEEKISAIISRKKDLMDSVIKEDDPGLLKGFSREELMELIRF